MQVNDTSGAIVAGAIKAVTTGIQGLHISSEMLRGVAEASLYRWVEITRPYHVQP